VRGLWDAWTDLLPLPGICGAGLHWGEDRLYVQSVGEEPLRLEPSADGCGGVHYLVGEAVLIPQSVLGGPPVPGIGMLGHP
jgi:hypothetical protein